MIFKKKFGFRRKNSSFKISIQLNKSKKETEDKSMPTGNWFSTTIETCSSIAKYRGLKHCVDRVLDNQNIAHRSIWRKFITSIGTTE